MTLIRVRVEGDKKLIRKLRKARIGIRGDIEAASVESIKEVLDTVGVRKYPPSTSGNSPPVPYYVRGQGTQTASGNLGNSERYGAKGWAEVKVKPYGAISTNVTSYGKYLGDDKLQAAHMGRIGWRKIGDVVNEKRKKLEIIFNKWIRRGLRKAGLL